MNIPLNPIVLAQFRMLSRDELQQIRAEAQRVIKLHRDNSIGGCLTPVGYLAIPQVEDETRKYETILEHADAVLKEWQALTANGDTLASEVVGFDTPRKVEGDTLC